jgi:glutamate mutase epsilon subunit
MWPYERLPAVIARWLSTGRFPREEFRVRPWIAFAFAIAVLTLATAIVVHQLNS